MNLFPKILKDQNSRRRRRIIPIYYSYLVEVVKNTGPKVLQFEAFANESTGELIWFDNLIEMIELGMNQRKLKQKDLAKILETTPSRISELRNRKRDITIDLARGLYKKLNVDPKLILNER